MLTSSHDAVVLQDRPPSLEVEGDDDPEARRSDPASAVLSSVQANRMEKREMKDSEILQKAQEIISDPKRWTQGSMTDDEGKRFCAVGALRSVTDPHYPYYLLSPSTSLIDLLGKSSVGRLLILAADRKIAEYLDQEERGARVYDAWMTTCSHRLPSPIFVNDRLGYAATMEMFAAAIELALENEVTFHTGHINDDPAPKVLEAVGR